MINTLQFTQMINLTVFLPPFFMEEASFLQALTNPEYWEALEQSEALALNGMAILKRLLLGLGNGM